MEMVPYCAMKLAIRYSIFRYSEGTTLKGFGSIRSSLGSTNPPRGFKVSRKAVGLSGLETDSRHNFHALGRSQAEGSNLRYERMAPTRVYEREIWLTSALIHEAVDTSPLNLTSAISILRSGIVSSVDQKHLSSPFNFSSNSEHE